MFDVESDDSEATRVTSLANFLFPAPAERNVGAIWRWWEARRLPYNLIVGSAGLLTLGVAQLAMWIARDPEGLLWQPAVAFGVAANICYSLGPVAETLIHKLWGRSVLPTGPALFRMGLTFSMALALLPILMFMLFAVASLFF